MTDSINTRSERWRIVADAYRRAESALRAASDQEEEFLVAFRSIDEARCPGLFDDETRNCPSGAALSEQLRKIRHADVQVAPLVDAYVKWREATARMDAAFAAAADLVSAGKARIATREAFDVLLETPAPDLVALNEKLQLVLLDGGDELNIGLIAEEGRRLAEETFRA